MSDRTALGDRMKRYECAFRDYFPRRTYTLLRLDGRAFHTYLRGCERPYDYGFIECMNLLAVKLCEEIQGVAFAYTQSDEVSVLLTDFGTEQTEPWVGGRVDKTLSLSASLAGAYFTRLRGDNPRLPTFDCRAWSMSDPVEVGNYFLWRQRDAVRNSIQMLGQHYFSQAQLDGKNGDEVQEMLFQEHQVNWNDVADGIKRGRVIERAAFMPGWGYYNAPYFKAEPDSWLAAHIPSLPSLA